MNLATTAESPRFKFNEKNADRLGVAASVLCAIHCAVAPFLLIALPTFGKIWAHPASHALVAILIVPLAAFSIIRGYRTHRKRWILASAIVGIFFVLGGAALPAFSKGDPVAAAPIAADSDDAPESGTCEESCESCCEESCEEDQVASTTETTGCTDQCCPSIQVSESGETSLHVPPAAIITTLGGIFLIAAHIGNLRYGAISCLFGDCCSV